MTRSVLLALLSGVLYVFSFAPWDQAYLQWVCFLPLFFAVDALPSHLRKTSRLFLIGMIPAATICLGGFYWMVYATEQYGELPLAAALSVFALFCLTGQLQIPLFLLLRRSFRESPTFSRTWFGSALLSGFFYAGIEAAYPKLFLDTAGHAFYHSPWIRQAADLGGPFLLTVLVVLVNELLYSAVKLKALRPLLYSALIGGFLSIYGIIRTTEYQDRKLVYPGDQMFKIAAVQANIGDFLKVAAERGGAEAGESVIGTYLRLTRLALAANPKPDAVVWPETAYPAVFQSPENPIEMQMDRRLGELLGETDASLLFGGYDSDRLRQQYNSLFFVQPSRKIRSVYHKANLLLFGETLPFADDFPEMKRWFPTMGFFGRGPGPEVMEVFSRSGLSFRFAPSICYEGLFTDHAVLGALQGADALLNVTNDSWFGPYGEPYLHLALTQFRSIETRLPLIRSTNTGISVVVDPLGETLKSSKVMQEEVISSEIPKRIMPEPPYLRIARLFGPNWFVRLCEAIALYGLLSFGFNFFRRPSKNEAGA